MNHRRLLFAFATFATLGATPLQSVMAATEFNCNINATDSQGKTVPVSAVQCSAIVSYVNSDTDESQNIVRSCKVNDRSSCSQTYDDSDVTISATGAGVAGINAIETAASSLLTQGCVSANVSREVITGDNGLIVNLTHEIACP